MCIDPVSLAATIGIGSAASTPMVAIPWLAQATSIPLTTAATASAGAGALLGGLRGAGGFANLGSGVLSAYSMLQNGRAQAAAAARTAAAQEEAARRALEAGEEKSDKTRRKAALLAGQQKISNAANGVDLGSASALDLLDDTALLAEADAFAIRENARSSATNFSQSAANSLAQGASANSQGTFGALGTLLTSASKVGKRWAPYATYA